jgi:Ni,Fe-hydrogenase III small subunit
MAKIIGINDKQTTQQSVGKPQVDISTSKPMICGECGYDVFISGTKIRRISKLITGTPQDMIIPIDVFVCGNCGGVNQELLPEQIRALEKVEKDTNGE